MNQIHFTIERSEEFGDMVVVPVIDGQELPVILKAFETKFAEYEGHPELAGQYVGVPISEIGDPIPFFLGQSPEFEVYDGKFAILECTCGVTGCWPFLVRISNVGDAIIWSDFEQPHRSVDSAGSTWDYSSLPPFEFSAKQYAQAIYHAFLPVEPI